MFVLRDAVIAALDRAALDHFVERLAAFLRDKLPGPTSRYDTAGLEAYIRESRTHAAEYGIRSEYGVANFTCVRLLVGDLRREPELHHFLSETSGVSPDERVGLLLKTSCQKVLANPTHQTGGV